MSFASRRRLLIVAAAWLATTTAMPALAARGRKTRRQASVADNPFPSAVAYREREDVMQFADAMAARRGLDPAWVRGALSESRFIPSVVRYIMPPPRGTAKYWAAYRARFVEPVRIGAGAAFWKANASWLATAEERYGVPPEIVVGILGVESIYGRQTGNFRVIDALATLAFDFPLGRSDRSGFFRDELESWFVLCENERIDPLAWKGSYAGAIGMAQFMPSSINAYAVDLDGDGRIDLHRGAADAIGSVANFLAEAGWQRGVAVRFDASPPADEAARAALLAADVVPTFSVADMLARGAGLPVESAATAGMLALVELENGDSAPSYVAGTVNFYAITRYNRSSYYALAVVELGEAIRRVASGAA